KRDAEALAAVQRAGQKPRFNDYAYDEVAGRWRLHEAAWGKESAFRRGVALASVLFPHYAQIRAVTRVATVKAVQAEQAGRAAEGLAIRQARLRCGARMRAQSHTLIGALVGVAISAIAMSRPGGVPPLAPGSSSSSDETARKRLDAYAAYLRRLGREEEA